jgi:hypothetical protein
MENDLKYKQKNSTIFIENNEYIDKLLYSLECSSVLSDSLKDKIINIAIVIVTNSDKGEWIDKSIHDLIEELRWVNIFSTDFISFITYNIKRGLNFELNKNK